MRYIKGLSIGLLLFGALFSCETTNKPKRTSDSFAINLRVNGLPNGSTIKLTERSSGKILDSLIANDMSIQFNGSLNDAPQALTLSVEDSTGTLGIDAALFIGNEDVEVLLSVKDNKWNFSVKGSKHHILKEKLDSLIDPLYDLRLAKITEMVSLREKGNWSDELQNTYWQADGLMDSIDADISIKLRGFISDNLNTDYALSQLVSYKSDFDHAFINQQLSALDAQYRNSKYARVLRTYVDSNELLVGEDFINFRAQNLSGELVEFKDAFKTKHVLLAFNSPNCGWSKRSYPAMDEILNQHKDLLTMVSFSVDNNEQDWKNSNFSVNRSILSLWDKEGRMGETFTRYRIFATPTYYLFDDCGALMAKWIGFDDNFEIELSKVLALAKEGLTLNNTH